MLLNLLGMMVSTVPSGLVIMTSYSGWWRDAWIEGVNHRLTMKVWPTPTGLGLKLKCETGVTVMVGVAPAGSGPMTATSAAALTGTINIANAEVIIRTTKIVATSFFVVLGLICKFFFSLNFDKPIGPSVGLRIIGMQFDFFIRLARFFTVQRNNLWNKHDL
jgi:hypothetical protein